MWRLLERAARLWNLNAFGLRGDKVERATMFADLERAGSRTRTRSSP
jgi:hypothetical protein